MQKESLLPNFMLWEMPINLFMVSVAQQSAISLQFELDFLMPRPFYWNRVSIHTEYSQRRKRSNYTERESKEKNLWSQAGSGALLTGYVAESSTMRLSSSKTRFVNCRMLGPPEPGDTAIFYRTNAQSRVFEEVFMRSALPYKVVGGVRFYERKEVKDLLAYLRVLVNPNDEVSLRRIINVPKRGIGDRALDYVEAFAQNQHPHFVRDCIAVAR